MASETCSSLTHLVQDEFCLGRAEATCTWVIQETCEALPGWGGGGGRGCRTGVGVRFLVQYLNNDDNHFVYPRISE